MSHWLDDLINEKHNLIAERESDSARKDRELRDRERQWHIDTERVYATIRTTRLEENLLTLIREIVIGHPQWQYAQLSRDTDTLWSAGKDVPSPEELKPMTSGYHSRIVYTLEGSEDRNLWRRITIHMAADGLRINDNLISPLTEQRFQAALVEAFKNPVTSGERT